MICLLNKATKCSCHGIVPFAFNCVACTLKSLNIKLSSKSQLESLFTSKQTEAQAGQASNISRDDPNGTDYVHDTFGVCLSFARLNIKVCWIDKQVLLVPFRLIGSRGVATCTHSTHVRTFKSRG